MNPGFSQDYCPTIYGPVQSRRHGSSLGINLGIANKKICSWGCIYCQCGMGERRAIRSDEVVPSAKDILELVRDKLNEGVEFDSITFAGNSEPTAHPEFYSIVKELLLLRKQASQSWILNCLSNGSELDKNEVVRACDLLDETWIKLDCALDELFLRHNRPIPKVGGVSNHIGRIERLHRIFIQTLVWRCPSNPQVSNWTEKNQNALLGLYCRLRPEKIHLTTTARAPAIPGILPVQEKELVEFSSKITQLGLRVEVFS